MRVRTFIISFLTALLGAASAPAQDKTDMVDLSATIPGIVIDLRYTSADNFFKTAFYPKGSLALLHRATAEKLARVQADLKKQNLSLKIWDAYRPLSVQRAMWKVLPDDRYVADPAKGGRHNRGAAVDVTLVDAQGRELPMPTAHDDFTEKAAAAYPKVSKEIHRNRQLLQDTMTRHGFAIYPSEWWHFDDTDWKRYEALDIPMVRGEQH